MEGGKEGVIYRQRGPGAAIELLPLQSIALSPACRSVYIRGESMELPSLLLFILLHGILHLDPI